MQWGWLYPKPKDPEAEVTLDGLRPLILLEVTRKIWVGIVVHGITRAWERHSVLDPAQHGFRPGRGTDSALLQLLNATEHAVETQLPLYTSSWDIRRAFDSVSREAMEVSWLLLGVPPAVSRWLAYMNVGGPAVIRTPWALATWKQEQYAGFQAVPSTEHPATFVRSRGTPQGDVSSPHNWVSFFDIALRALALDQQDRGETAGTAFQAAGRQVELYTTGDISYADDQTWSQRKADILSAFTVLFDMELSPAKLRLAVFGPCPPDMGPTPGLVIHVNLWAPTHVPLRTSGIIRMLGVTFDTTSPERACTTLCAQRRLDSAVIAASVSSLTRASYTAQFSPWVAQELAELDVPLNQLFRRLSGNMRTFPPTYYISPPLWADSGSRGSQVEHCTTGTPSYGDSAEPQPNYARRPLPCSAGRPPCLALTPAAILLFTPTLPPYLPDHHPPDHRPHSGYSNVGLGTRCLPRPPSPPPDPPPPWTAIFQDHLDPQYKWRIYVDGIWRAELPRTPHDFFLETGTTQGGGCIVVTQDTEDWVSAPIYVLPFTVPSMAEEYGGIPKNCSPSLQVWSSWKPSNCGAQSTPTARDW